MYVNLDGFNEWLRCKVTEFLLCAGEAEEGGQSWNALFYVNARVHSNYIVGEVTGVGGKVAYSNEGVLELKGVLDVRLLSNHYWL